MLYHIKFSYNGEFRRVSSESLRFGDLAGIARELYDIPNVPISLGWTDEDGDEVVSSGDKEFEEFSEYILINGSIIGTIRLRVFAAKEEANTSVHKTVTCDGCGVRPIVGIRYKCTVRNNYDLCSACEKRATQPYPMIKIYSPDVNVDVMESYFSRRNGCHSRRRERASGDCPAKLFFSKLNEVANTALDNIDEAIFKEAIKMSTKDVPKTHEKNDEKEPAKASCSPTASSACSDYAVPSVMTEEDINCQESEVVKQSSSDDSRGKLSARFMQDISFPDGTVLHPNTQFVKSWSIRNDGNCNWPNDCFLRFADGDELKGQVAVSVPALKPGEQHIVSINLQTPIKPGRYISYYVLCSRLTDQFGPKLWVDITVRDPKPDKPKGEQGFPVPAFAKGVPVARGDGPTVVGTVVTASPPPSSIPASAPQQDTAIVNQLKEWESELDQLAGMGFYDTSILIPLLITHVKYPASKYPHLEGRPFRNALSSILDGALSGGK